MKNLTEDNLYRLFHTSEIIPKLYNTVVKTKYMIISKEPVRCKLEVKGKLILQMKYFKYSIYVLRVRKLSFMLYIKGAQISKYL